MITKAIECPDDDRQPSNMISLGIQLQLEKLSESEFQIFTVLCIHTSAIYYLKSLMTLYESTHN